jgi:hypothetical protein
MYNKLFTKILDSSVWLAPDSHRLVWVTFLAAMDEDGNVMFASAANVAARARVTREQADAAISSFESPDLDSGDPDNEGRRIERFPGGWHILNAHKYRALVTKAIIREQTRQRVAKHRSARSNDDVTHGSAAQAASNVDVTPSVALSAALAETKVKDISEPTVPHPPALPAGQPSKRKKSPGINRQVLVDAGVQSQHLDDWLEVRATPAKKAGPLTATAWAAVCREAAQAGLTLDDAVRIAAENSWAGFKASWWLNLQRQKAEHQGAMANHKELAARQRASELSGGLTERNRISPISMDFGVMAALQRDKKEIIDV